MVNKTENITTATPSLNKLSPPIIASSFFGTFNLFNRARTATGSVGETITPKIKQ